MELVGPQAVVEARLLLDTGAAYSMVHPLLLTRIGVDVTAPRSNIRIATVTHIRTAPLYIVPEVRSFGVSRNRVPVLGQPLPTASRLDGLLGLNFFRGYRLTIDLRSGTIEME
ncbi:MAG: aspartyl protease family protein [Dehalococcoidia bacterium]